NESDYTEIERNPMYSSNTIYLKCNDCGEKGFYYHVNSGSSCAFCFKELDVILVKEDEKQTYEAYANPHVAEEKRIYQRYLKLKNKFSDGKQKLREKKQRLAELEGDKQQEKDTKKPTN
ncbi:14949_t:CDS:2, partial [Entrophospora sp. SA101]